MACCNDCADSDRRRQLGILLFAVGIVGLFYTLYKGGRS